MTFGKTVLPQKDLVKGSAVDNYRPIPCLPLMWRLMTGILAEMMYSHFERENLLISEQLLIDKEVLRNCKRRHTNLAIAWIDHKSLWHGTP